MTTMTIESTATGPDDENSYNVGLFDGELAAITKLSSPRAHARAAMADQYDPLYAQGYIDGYLAGIERNYAYATKESTR